MHDSPHQHGFLEGQVSRLALLAIGESYHEYVTNDKHIGSHNINFMFYILYISYPRDLGIVDVASRHLK